MPSPKKVRTPDPTMEWCNLKELRVTTPPHVVRREFASETVLLNVETGIYYGMDDVGTRFLEVLTESADLVSALAVLVSEFEEDVERIRQDLTEFTSELRKLGLVSLEPLDRR